MIGIQIELSNQIQPILLRSMEDLDEAMRVAVALAKAFDSGIMSVAFLDND